MRGKKCTALVAAIAAATAMAVISGCGATKPANTGFPSPLEKLTSSGFESPLWKLVRENLGIGPVEGQDLKELIAGLGVPSTWITDASQAAVATRDQIATVNGSAELSVCLDIQSPLIDIDPGSALGSTGAFTLSASGPTPLNPPARVYWMRYRLIGDTDYRSALVTVPSLAPAAAHSLSSRLGSQSATGGNYGYPLILYAHAGASGLAYEEIAQSLGALQAGHIIAAPVFPGEPLCTTYDGSGTTRSISCSAGNVLSPAVGTSHPYETDVTDLLGLYDCLRGWAAGGAKPVVNRSLAASGSEDLSTKIIKTNAAAQNAFASGGLTLPAAAAGSPVAIVAGAGRGAGVVGLALARAGALNSTLLSSTPDTGVYGNLISKGVKPALFSCALLVAPQATFSAGKNRIFLDYWTRNSSGLLTPAQQSASRSIPAFAAIQDRIEALRDDPNLSDSAKAMAIADFVKSIDLTMHAPLLHGGLQNFGKQFTAKLLAQSQPAVSLKTASAAKGALFLLHGSQDAVADVGNAALLSAIGSSTSQALAAAVPPLAPGAGWLALEVAPPAANLNGEGHLPSGDSGHVNSASFIGGKTTRGTSLVSTAPSGPYEGVTPSAAIALWLAGECGPAYNADPSP